MATIWASEVPTYAQKNGFSQQIRVYRLDLIASFGNSGGPAFLGESQAVIGMVIEVNGSIAGGGWTASALPASYITEYLSNNHIAWESLNAGK